MRNENCKLRDEIEKIKQRNFELMREADKKYSDYSRKMSGKLKQIEQECDELKEWQQNVSKRIKKNSRLPRRMKKVLLKG